MEQGLYFEKGMISDPQRVVIWVEKDSKDNIINEEIITG